MTVTEGDAGSTDATLTVSLSAASGKTVTVDYATLAGTATAGDDYTAGSGTLTFSPGDTSKTVTVPVLGDTTDEIDEALTVELSNAVNATIDDGSGEITIDDDDGPSLSIDDVSATEGTGTGGTATFTVSLSAASPQTVSVAFTSADGTATAPADYTAVSGTLTFAPGDTSKTVSVALEGDSVDEPDETFTVVLSDAVDGSIGDGSGTGTIVDDDEPPAGEPIDTSALPDSVGIDAICPPGKKQRGSFTGQVSFAEPGRAKFDLFAEFKQRKGNHHGDDDHGHGHHGHGHHEHGHWARKSGGWKWKTISFRLGKLRSHVDAGVYEFTIKINRGRCQRLRSELAHAGDAGGTLVLTIKQKTDDGDRVAATKRIAITN